MIRQKEKQGIAEPSSRPDLSFFYRRIRRSLPCRLKEKRTILKELRTSIDVYLDRHPEAGEAEIYEEFGTPAEIVESYLAEADFKKVNRVLHLAPWIQWALVFCAVIFFLFLGLARYNVAIGLPWKTHKEYDVVMNSNPAPEEASNILHSQNRAEGKS